MLSTLTPHRRESYQELDSEETKLAEQCKALSSFSLEELRAKLVLAKRQRAQNRRVINAAGEQGQQLLVEQARLEERLSGCENALVDTAVPEELPSSILGKNGELHLPRSAAGLRIYKQIVKQHKEFQRVSEQIIAIEGDLAENKGMLQDHLNLTRHNFEAQFTGALKFVHKIKRKGALASSMVERGKVNEQLAKQLHDVSEQVKGISDCAKQAAEARGRERTEMEREMYGLQSRSTITLAKLRKQLEDTTLRNTSLRQELFQQREIRTTRSQSLFVSTAQLEDELEDLCRGAQMAEVQVRKAHNELESAHADHCVAQKIAENRRSLAVKASLIPKIPLHVLANSDSSSEISEGSSEYWDGAEEVGDRRNADPRIVSMLAKQNDRRGKRKPRVHGKRHVYKDDMEVVVNAADTRLAEKEDANKAKEEKPQQDENGWELPENVSWAAWTAAEMMGDVLLKIDEMTREAEPSAEEPAPVVATAKSRRIRKRRA